jgi:hypothetical protein
MLELDMIVPVHLTKLFLPGMLDRGSGWVLNIASIGAYQPSPLYASYSAVPGIVATEFLQVSGQQAHPLPAAGHDGQPDSGPHRRRRHAQESPQPGPGTAQRGQRLGQPPPSSPGRRPPWATA